MNRERHRGRSPPGFRGFPHKCFFLSLFVLVEIKGVRHRVPNHRICQQRRPTLELSVLLLLLSYLFTSDLRLVPLPSLRRLPSCTCLFVGWLALTAAFHAAFANAGVGYYGGGHNFAILNFCYAK